MLFHFVFLLVALWMVSAGDAVLVGGLGSFRQRERPASNVVQTSRFLYPREVDLEPPCKTDLGYLGFCVDVRLCYAAKRAVAAGNHPIRCGWVDHAVPMVCCHPDQVQQPKPVFKPPYYS